MAIGKRITARLNTLGWRRRDLLERVPELSAQALSNLITRDSKRSELDQSIAHALGMSVVELVYGCSDDETNSVKQPPAFYETEAVTRLLKAARKLDDKSLRAITDLAESLAR